MSDGLKSPSVAKGSALPWSDFDIDRLSTVTPADVEAGAALWRREAPGTLRNLIEAEPTPDARRRRR
jgi:hypothetical protein